MIVRPVLALENRVKNADDGLVKGSTIALGKEAARPDTLVRIGQLQYELFLVRACA